MEPATWAFQPHFNEPSLCSNEGSCAGNSGVDWTRSGTKPP